MDRELLFRTKARRLSLHGSDPIGCEAGKNRVPVWRLTLFSAVLLVLGGSDTLAGSPPSPSDQEQAGEAGASPVRIRLISSLELEKRQERIVTRWAEQVRRQIVPTLHLVETPHFLIYTAWNPENDAPLQKTCEAMYASLQSRFELASGGSDVSPWPGKLPIFVFWQRHHFRRFATQVDQVSEHQRKVMHADGYHATKNGFSYIVLNRPHKAGMSRSEAITRFYSLLVHEGTHAFLARYLTPRQLPRWLNEGMADFMAADIVPGSKDNQAYITATKRALARNEAIRDLFTKEHLTPHEYGIAQSIVRFLIRSDEERLTRFIKALKNGLSQEKALRQVYDRSLEDLVSAWKRTSLQMIRARP